jgi:hypothetical protein
MLKWDAEEETLLLFDTATQDYTLNWYKEIILKDPQQDKIMDIMRLEPRSEHMEEDDVEPIVSEFKYFPAENIYRAKFFSSSGLGYFMLEKYFAVDLCGETGKIIHWTRLPHPKKWVQKWHETNTLK